MVSNYNYSFYFEHENGKVKICQDSIEDDHEFTSEIKLSASQIDYFIDALEQFRDDIDNS